MALLSLYTWNEDDANNSRDYSTNGNDSTAMVVTSIINAEILKAANLDGVDDVITFGDINNVGGTDNLSIFVKIRIGGTAENPIAFKKDQYNVGIDVNAKAFMRLTIGAAVIELVSSNSVATGGDFKTVAWTYDGSAGSDQGKIYIDGVLDSSTLTQTGNLDASSSAFKIGSDDTDFGDVRVEMLSFYSQTLTQDEVTALNDKPGGFVTDFKDTSDFEIGDMLQFSDIGDSAGSQSVITGDLGSNQLLLLPIANDIPRVGAIMRQVGNVFDTERQWISESFIEDFEPILQIKDRVDNFTKADRTTEVDKGFRYTTEALKWKTVICPDFSIEPPSEPGSIDDFNPTDLAFANVLYISSDNPVMWTGLQAPSPSKPQLIFIINIGTKNITIRNDDSASLAANRFFLNTNVILSPNDCGFLLYDEVRLRWRVNKI